MSIESVLELARPEIRALHSYDNLRGETSVDAIIIDSNENIASPSQELTDQERYRYPAIRPQALVKRLATIYDISPEQLMLGRGSDDVIDSLLRVFCTAGQDSILQVSPCFSMYAIAAQIQNAAVISFPLERERNYQYDIDAFIQAYKTNIDKNIKLIFLATPQSHIGNSLNRHDLKKLLEATKRACIVVIDEAYIELSDKASASSLLQDYPHLIIMRTLSKAYGLANVRCGAMLAHSEVVKLVRKVVTPYALPGVVVDTVYSALNQNSLKRIAQINSSLAQRKRVLSELLKQQTWCQKQFQGDSNYILCVVDDAQKLNAYLETKNIFVRNFSPASELGDCIRFSVGSESDLTTLKLAFADFN